MRARVSLLAASLLVVSCGGTSGSTASTVAQAGVPFADDSHARLPTGVRLDPASELHPIGQMPLAMVAAPEGDRVVMLLNGWRDEGIQVVERSSGRVLQTITLPAAFLGLAFSPDGQHLYASGGNTDNVYVFTWHNGQATLADSIVLHRKATARSNGVRYPGGIAVSANGRTLYVAENLADSLAVIDVGSGQVTQRVATGRYPYGVSVTPSGVFVSNWGSHFLSVFTQGAAGQLVAGSDIHVGRHPSALLANASGSRLFVTLASLDRIVSVDPARHRVVGELLDHPPSGPEEGSTPNALALSADGMRLFVAEADANAVAVFDLSASTSGVKGAPGDDRLVGRIPTGWYPSAVLARGGELLVASAKGRGTRANPDGPSPATARDKVQLPGRNTTLAQLAGGFMNVSLATADRATLESYSARVERANGWVGTLSAARGYPPIEHVIYIIKENRTYDQMLGDLAQADGDSGLTLFPRSVTPNHHALAERFGIFDRFFVNAEVSADGHNWSTAAYATDYVEKTVQLNYSQRGRSYDYEGSSSAGGKNVINDDDVNAPAQGYLWDLANRKGITFRNYGEFVVPDSMDPDDALPSGYRGDKPFLAAHTNAAFPGFALGIPDQKRADIWLAEFAEFTRRGAMPALEIIRLPNDHTSGASAGMPTPRAAVADNDLALGRIVSALSNSPFWKSTVVFVLEDDAQNGPDHVDSHRSPLLVISPWVRAGAVHRFANTTDVLRTIEELLGLDALSQFDHYGRPLREIWSSTADTRGYAVLTPEQSLDERNPRNTNGARQSQQLNLNIEDVTNEDLFNHVIWDAVRPGTPYPGTRRAGTLESLRP